jgi:hypothetical protein
MRVGAVRIHDVLLIAIVSIACRLKYEALSIRSPVRFRVFAAVRQLPEIIQSDVVDVRLGLNSCTACQGNKEKRSSKPERNAE